MIQSRRVVHVYHFGSVPFAVSWNWQQRLLRARLDGQDSRDVLLLLEHPAVYTQGRSGCPSEILSSHDTRIPVIRVDRGGRTTHHCPGQLVVYPLLDLHRFTADLRWYLRSLEEVVIRVLGGYGLEGRRDSEHTGVWVKNDKVCAIGVGARKWITSHGAAINVNCDLAGFRGIVPCGIADPDLGVSSIQKLLDSKESRLKVRMNDVRHRFVKEFESIFEVDCVDCPGSSSPLIDQS